MNAPVYIHPKLVGFLDVIGAAGRHNLYSVGANALKIEIQRYLATQAPIRHASADSIGGDRTGHLEKGAARISFTADSNKGVVTIPIAGIGRAFHDVEITPKNGKSLTIPVEGPAYGHRVAELRRMGWSIFRPHGQDALWGSNGDDGETMPLYILRMRVRQRQDRSLLPDDKTMGSAVARAMMNEIRRVAAR